jgi:hypothetical protein
MALTVPGAVTWRGGVLQHVNNYTVPPLYQTANFRRAIPEAKVAAVKAVLAADSDHWSIDFGGPAIGQFRDGRGVAVQFKTAKTEAQVNTFLAAVDTAAT